MLQKTLFDVPIWIKEVDNFDNLYVPGFHRVSEVSSWGAGLNYTIMYQFPIYRK